MPAIIGAASVRRASQQELPDRVGILKLRLTSIFGAWLSSAGLNLLVKIALGRHWIDTGKMVDEMVEDIRKVL